MSASSARGSSGTAPCRPISTSISTTWSARANAAATSPKPRVKSAATLPPGNSAGSPGRRPPRRPAPRAPPRCRCPPVRRRPRPRTGPRPPRPPPARPRTAPCRWPAPAAGRRRRSASWTWSRTGMASPAGRLAAVTTVTTPSARAARPVPTARSRPCATGERTTRAQQLAAAGRSRRRTGPGRGAAGGLLCGHARADNAAGEVRAAHGPAPRRAARPGGRQHGLDDALVAGAPAQVGRDQLADLLLVGLGGVRAAGPAARPGRPRPA